MTSDNTIKKGGFHYAFLIVATGIVITCVPCAIVLSCAGIFFTPLANYFGVPLASASMNFSIMSIAMMISLPIAGRLMNKVDLRIVLSACVALCSAVLIFFSFAGALWQFYVGNFILGLAIAPLIYLSIPTLINAWCVKRVGFFIGLCMAFTGIGGVIFNPLGTVFIQAGPEGWRTGYLVFGLIILIALPFTIFIVRSKPEDKGLKPYGYEDLASQAQSDGGKIAETGVPCGKAVKTAAFFAVAAFCGLITLNQTVYQFLPSYVTSLSQSIPTLAALTGVVASACMAGQAIGKVILGAINDKSVKGGMLFGIGFGIIGVLLMWILPAQAIILLVGSFMFGFVYACTTVQSPLLTRSVFGTRDYTSIYSYVSMVGSIFSAIAAVFWGWICGLPNGYSIMFILSLVVMVASILLGMFALHQSKKLEKTAE